MHMIAIENISSRMEGMTFHHVALGSGDPRGPDARCKHAIEDVLCFDLRDEGRGQCFYAAQIDLSGAQQWQRICA
jgi:hypothetical protein